jgi:ankyrin repeat protein
MLSSPSLSHSHFIDPSLLQAIEMNKELHNCAGNGNLERVKELVEGGADLEEIDEHGNTALLLAILEDRFEIVRYVVKHGANVAHTNSDGITALHCVCAGGVFRR